MASGHLCPGGARAFIEQFAELFCGGAHVTFPALCVVLGAACRIKLGEHPGPEQRGGRNITFSRQPAQFLDPLDWNANAIDRRRVFVGSRCRVQSISLSGVASASSTATAMRSRIS
jgi:hypothetical protein